MKLRTIWGLTSIFAVFGALTAVGCGEAERTYDCIKICDKYAECIDDDINKSDCVDHCEDQGDADPDFAQQADDCEKCIDDESCTAATIECAGTCGPVVAAST